MFFTVYQITNNVNGKIYIGKHQTKDLNDGYMGSGKHLRRAIEKYGIESFTKEILFQFDNEADMNAKEAELVTEEFCLREDTYNLCPGGRGGFGYINSAGLSVKQFVNSNFAKENSQKANEKKRLLWDTDRRWSEEYRQNLSNGAKEYVAKNGNSFKGKTHTDEWKARQSEVMRKKTSGSNNSQFGTMWITDGTSNKKVKKDVDFVPEGWYKGRTYNSKFL